jgi:hypothetical protein
MESYGLILKDGPRDAEWLLEWNDAKLTLTTPEDELVLETCPAALYQLIDLFDLYVEGKISMASPTGTFTFRKEYRALSAVRKLVEAGLAGDVEFCARLQREALRGIVGGMFMFIIGGTLFGLYCWYVSWAPDPPPGHWIRWFGWLIHGVLLILLGMTFGGPLRCFYCLRQWQRVRRIVRSARSAQPQW